MLGKRVIGNILGHKSCLPKKDMFSKNNTKKILVTFNNRDGSTGYSIHPHTKDKIEYYENEERKNSLISVFYGVNDNEIDEILESRGVY
jgi:hypothetical protein